MFMESKKKKKNKTRAILNEIIREGNISQRSRKKDTVYSTILKGNMDKLGHKYYFIQ